MVCKYKSDHITQLKQYQKGYISCQHTDCMAMRYNEIHFLILAVLFLYLFICKDFFTVIL